MGQASIVTFEDSFLLVGGFNGDLILAPLIGDIYQYNAALDTFEKLASELKTPRYQHVSLLVPQSLFTECPSSGGGSLNFSPQHSVFASLVSVFLHLSLLMRL